MKVPSINYKLSSKTFDFISQTTRLSKEELQTLTLEEAYNKMRERGAT